MIESLISFLNSVIMNDAIKQRIQTPVVAVHNFAGWLVDTNPRTQQEKLIVAKKLTLALSAVLGTLIIASHPLISVANDAVEDVVEQAEAATKIVAPVEPEAQASTEATTKAPAVVSEDADKSDALNSVADQSMGRYVIKNADGQVVTTIRVNKAWETGHASVYVNNKEVMRFRSPLDDKNETTVQPFDRAKEAAKQLNDFVVGGGQPDVIVPAVLGGQPIIMLGRTEEKAPVVMAVADTKTAEASSATASYLAFVWVNNLRSALGGTEYVDASMMMPGKKAKSKKISKVKLPLEESLYQASVKEQKGLASWYGPGFHGRRAANGSRFDMTKLTAAHKFLPFGTVVKVLNHRTNKTVLVRITDRGPFVHGRIIDLSKAAADAVGLTGSGVAKVTIEVLNPKPPSEIGRKEEPITADNEPAETADPVKTEIEVVKASS